MSPDVNDNVRSSGEGTHSHTLRLASWLVRAANVTLIELTRDLHRDNNMTGLLQIARVHLDLILSCTGRLPASTIVARDPLFLLR